MKENGLIGPVGGKLIRDEERNIRKTWKVLKSLCDRERKLEKEGK